MLPWYLDVLLRISPLRYAVGVNLLVVGAMFAVSLVVGTALFVRGKRNR